MGLLRWRGQQHSAEGLGAVVSQGSLTIVGHRSSEAPERALDRSPPAHAWARHSQHHAVRRCSEVGGVPVRDVPCSPPPILEEFLHMQPVGMFDSLTPKTEMF